jgi:hypothetical protein
MQFLMGLNDSYAHARGQILMIKHLPPNQCCVLSCYSGRETERNF